MGEPNSRFSARGKLGAVAGLAAILAVVGTTALSGIFSADAGQADAGCSFGIAQSALIQYPADYGWDTPEDAVAARVRGFQDRANLPEEARNHVVVRRGDSSDWFTVLEDGRTVARFQTTRLPNGKFVVEGQVYCTDGNYSYLSDTIRPAPPDPDPEP
ncbi:MAG: hypothetical protein ACE5F5_06960 [Acidimicrobiia bacterium]